ncbi:MAG TPA: biotin/lipoyl-containing protein, partial [Steroidobacteraceae bacterium]|nr:biotin/lipoyl-containing protein [Steroidobacteraceae bacterium]
MNAAAGVVEVRVPDMGNFKDVAVIDVLVKPGDMIALDTPLVTLESDKATMDVPSTAVGVVEKIHTSKGGTVNTGDLIATVRADGAQATAAPGEARGPAAAPAAEARAASSPAPSAAAATSARAASPPAPPVSAQGAASAASRGPSASAPDAAASSTAPRGAVLTPRSLLGVPTSYRSDLAPIDEPGFTRAHASPSVRRFARELGVNLAQVAGHGFKDRITHDDVKAFVQGTLAT